MNLMTSEENGGDLDCTIAPHLSAELADVWGGGGDACATASAPPPGPKAVSGGGDGGAAVIAATNALGSRSTSDGWTCQVWHEEYNLPMWIRWGRC